MAGMVLSLVIGVTVVVAGVALADFIRWIGDAVGPWWAAAFVAVLCAVGVLSLAVFG